MEAKLDTLSAPCNGIGSAPKCYVDTYFDNVTIGAGVHKTGTTSASQNLGEPMSSTTSSINGRDFETDLESFFGQIDFATICIVDTPCKVVGGPGGNPEYITQTVNVIQDTEFTGMPAGAKQFRASVIGYTSHSMGVPPPQTGMGFARKRPGGIVLSDIPRMYVKYRTKFQADLLTRMDNGIVSPNYYVPIDIKTGGKYSESSLSIGDMRFTVQIHSTVADGLYWVIRFDNSANGLGIIPQVGNDTVDFWRVTDKVTEVPLDVEIDIEYYLQLPEANENIDPDSPLGAVLKNTIGGRCYFAYTIVSTGEKRILVNNIDGVPDPRLPGVVTGDVGIMRGNTNAPWQRMLWSYAYSRATYTYTNVMGRLQVWDRPPSVIGTIFNPTFGPLPWVPTPLSRATYFGASNGNDANPGTELLPKTYQGAVNAGSAPGSVVFFRGGTIAVTTAAHFNLWNDGTAENPIIYEAYPGETVIIDGSGITPGVGNQRNVNMSGSYQKLRGVTVQNMPEYGIFIGGNYNTVDGCTVTGNKLSGIITYTSGSGPWSAASYNTIINNWVHHNSDVGLLTGNYNNGGNADGIAPSRGYGNKVQHNLVEYNSDDGIDSWISWSTEISYNIVRYNGLGNGNGNGIKAGGNSQGKDALVQHNLVYGNVSVGIDVNTGITVTFKSNTTWDNATGYGLGADTTNTRNVSIGDAAIKYGTGIATGNSWNITGTPTFISTTEGDADFLRITNDGTFYNIGAQYL